MNTRQSFIKAHKKIITDIALETLLTSHWVPDTDLDENSSRKIFTDIFTQVDRDLTMKLNEDGFRFSENYLNIFRKDPSLSQNFSAQLAFLSVARIVLNHFLFNQENSQPEQFPGILEKIQKIFDFTLVSMGQWWGDIYRDIRKKDLQLISELNIVKNDLQKQLDVIYQILKESPVATVRCDGDLTILLWNPAAVRLTGYTPADILKQKINGIFTQSSREKLVARLSSDRKRISNLRLYIRPKIGNPFQTLVSVSRIRYPGPAAFHYVFNLQEMDNTAAGREKGRRKMNPLMTITRLSSAIMHDIRNPLNSIGLNVEILEQFVEDPSEEKFARARELLSKVQHEIQQLSQNLQHYLAYGSLAELYFETFDFSEKFKSFVDDMSLEATVKKVKINYQHDGRDHWISGDWLQLNRVFMNIIQNAFDVSPLADPIRIKLTGRNNRVVVTVEDKGRGISETQKEKIFEPFYSTKRSGTGLGLFISREIVRAHGGRITCRPAKTGGTIFRVSLPAGEKGGNDSHV